MYKLNTTSRFIRLQPLKLPSVIKMVRFSAFLHHLTIENVTLVSYDSSTNKLIILSHFLDEIMTVLVYFSSENKSDESKQRSQHSAYHSNTQSCFEWFSVLNESVESKIQWPIHKHLSHSWWIGRLNESFEWTTQWLA